ncbi:Protein of unknown function DUF2617 [Mycolicibacterium rutilum]|uniref:DUF2617 domain-containing protein n=1 Tax=Mycolicibacterium rutilum TaxID=370526 RepID=A0A1H6LLT8_MYCRU|nr:DUF2617 family protein [Mycolicibacterium rutilum]SEH87080.1 Protein of unknown function DUF2617 [Mycolicibacterium rutilum]
MPLHRLAVSPADVSGSTLRLALNAPAPTPLATRVLHHPDGTTLTLGVLGASHLVTVDAADHAFSEEVSCTAQSDAALPGHATAPGYRIRSRTEIRGAADFHRLAHTLRDNCERHGGWLGGVFPGDDAALTALCAEPGPAGWRWQTWHLYPSEAGGTVVHTTSRWQR